MITMDFVREIGRDMLSITNNEIEYDLNNGRREYGEYEWVWDNEDGSLSVWIKWEWSCNYEHVPANYIGAYMEHSDYYEPSKPKFDILDYYATDGDRNRVELSADDLQKIKDYVA